MLSQDERRLLDSWNDTARSYPTHLTLSDLISAQAIRTPDATALRFEGQSLTFAALETCGREVARRLRAVGVRPGDLVGVAMERSLELVVGLVGILEAGAAYVPFDPEYPDARLRFMLDDSQVRILLTQEALASRFRAGHVEILCLDVGELKQAAQNAERSNGARDARGLAYVIYTSGSTGKPKGAMIAHRAIVNRLLWMQETFALGPQDRVLQKTPSSFDVSVWEFFWPLITGAELILAKPGGHRDPAYLVDTIERHQITTVHFVPSMLHHFLDRPDLGRCSSLRRVICSGEALPHALQERCFARLNAELHNLYGPTEAAVDVTWWPCERGGDLRTVPIGRAIANTQLHVLDSALEPVAIGEVGELFIGGVQVGMGYHARPELTAEKFLADPFRAEPDARLYRTGDLVRYLPNGALEYLGRIDHQVKLRGFRVELGEIEAAINACPGVRESVVALRQTPTGEKQLVAYVVPDDQSASVGASEVLERWREIFDRTYARGADTGADDFDVAGWNSSYTGEPIPEEEMRVFVEGAVARIRELEPSRVLEIGCGTGMLLLRLAPHCERYVGTDISAVGLRSLAGKTAQRTPHAELLERPADEFSGFAAGSFDAVVINSVVQLFPDAGYLGRVLAGAARCLRPGGAVFLGDIRSLRHLEAFHTTLEFERAPPTLTVRDLRQRVRTRGMLEEELLLAPEYFESLAERIPAFTAAHVRLKRGVQHNELTRFRYDVVLRSDEGAAPWVAAPVLDWSEVGPSLEGLSRRIASEQPEALWVTGIPNARLARERDLLEALATAEPQSLVGDLDVRAAALGGGGIDPEDLWQAIEGALPYRVEITWNPERFDRMDALFVRRDTGILPHRVRPARPRALDAPLQSGFSHPERGAAIRLLGPDLRQRLRETLPEHMVPARLMVLDALPLSPNGKVDRNALPEPESVRPDSSTDYVAPTGATEVALAEVWSEVLGIDRVSMQDDFLDLGGDSILALLVVARAAKRGLRLTAAQIFEHRTISELARIAGRGGAILADQDAIRGAHTLTPMQHWVLEHAPQSPKHTSQMTLLRSTRRLDSGCLDRALGALVEHHDALRLRFHPDGGSLRAEYGPAERVPKVSRFETGGLDHEVAATARSTGAELNASLDPAHGPLFRVALLDAGPQQPQHLLLSVHHLITDGVSLRILLGDLQSAYLQAERREAIRFEPKTTSFQLAAARLAERAHRTATSSERGYWTAPDQAAQLPLDHPDALDREGQARHVDIEFDPEETQVLLRDVPRLYRARVDDALLAGLAQAVSSWTHDSRLRIETESHGRDLGDDDIDLSRTVGCFSALFPLTIELGSERDPASLLKTVKEERRRVPGTGIGYGLLRYLSNDPDLRELLAGRPEASLLFNYLGQLDVSSNGGFLEFVQLPAGVGRDPEELRTHRIDVQAWVADRRLHVRWIYGEQCYREETVRGLADAHRGAIKELIAHCRLPEAGGYTPSDFPLVSLDQATVDELTKSGEVEQILPLGPLQKGILFHTFYAPDSGIYFDQLATTFNHAVDLDAFETAWQRAVKRHPSLRTRFVWEGVPEPLQLVMRSASMPFDIEDLRPCNEDQRRERLHALAMRRDLGYSLTSAPLGSVRLLRLDEARFRMIWNFHHIIIDGWSMIALFEEILRDYEAGRERPLAPVAVAPGFGAYLTWVSREGSEAARDAWRRQLAGFSRPTPLPGDRDPESLPIADGNWNIQTLELPQRETEQMVRFAREHRLTFNTLLIGAWGLFLGFASDRSDVVFGSVVPGRPASLPGSETIIGLLMNTLPVRARFELTEPLFEWLAQLQRDQADAREHGHLSLVEIQSLSDVPRGQPLFNSVVGIQGDFRNNLSLASWAQERGLSDTRLIDWNSLPLSLGFELGPSLAIHFKYSRSRFTDSTIMEAAASYHDLLRALLEAREIRIDQFREEWRKRDSERRSQARALAREKSREGLRGARRRAKPSS